MLDMSGSVVYVVLVDADTKTRTWLNIVGKSKRTISNIRVTFVIYYHY